MKNLFFRKFDGKCIFSSFFWLFRSAGYAFPPLGVPADLQSAVKKCPNLFMLWGYVIPSPQAVAGISMG